jgi:hypothetical protein
MKKGLSMDNRGGIQSQIVESSEVGLGGNEFETGLINVAANATIKKGTVLKRNGTKFEPVTDIDAETPVAINPKDITNSGGAAADMSFRAIIFGPVRADVLKIGDVAVTNPAHFDKIRANALCIPMVQNDISRTS